MPRRRTTEVPHVTVGEENSASIDLHYEDHGTGHPVVLIHGFPLSGRSWEKQVPALLEAGRRVIAYDRRGFGKSSQPVTGYDYDTLTEDLHRLILTLDLRDVALVGFSMGGGEVAHYLGTHGSERVRSAVIISAPLPFLLKTPDNPEGVDGSVFEGLRQSIAKDRLAFLTACLSDFYNVDLLLGTRISEEVVRDSWNIASGASPAATSACIPAYGTTDFRSDLARIDVPTLVMHGDADRFLPLATTGLRTHRAVEGSRLVVVEGGPHGMLWTHAEEVNRALVEFLGRGATTAAA
jgi:non-heme chloroperoxidase